MYTPVMASRTGLLAVAAVVWALQGCSKSSNAVSCTDSLSTYCGAHPCASHVDPNDVVRSFCAAQTAIDNFGTVTCSDAGGNFEIDTPSGNTQLFFEYDSTGQLVAILQLDVDAAPPGPLLDCLAGPSTYEVPGSCMSNLIGYACVRDGGAD